MSRKGAIQRETKETSIKIELELDGSGEAEINTGNRPLDHFLSQLALHSLFDIKITATGVDPHHLVEDIAICLGRALNQALGEGRGIRRFGSAIVPMDEALVMVAIDMGGRGCAQADIPGEGLPQLPIDLVHHFLRSFAVEGKFNLHAQVLRGDDEHHKIEALFKALARALDIATRIDDRLKGKIPSTKEMLDPQG